MNKAELRRLARHMASTLLRSALNEGALETGLEMRNIDLSEDETKKLAEAMQEIIDRLGRP